MSDRKTDDLLKEVTDRVTAIMTEDDDGEFAGRVRDTAREHLEAILPEMVDARVEDLMGQRDYRAEPDPTSDEALRGTKYGRLGMSMTDCEFAFDLLAAANDFKPNRFPGPKPELRNLVAEAREKREKDRAEFSREHDTAESGYGAELTPDAEYIPELWDGAREQYGMLLGAIPSENLHDMPGPVTTVPVFADVPLMLYVSEKTGTIASGSEYATVKVGTNEVTLTAKKFIGHMNTSGELVEDSIIPLVPLLRRASALGLAKTADHLILNGDETNAATGNINLDDADPADTLYYLAEDGLRHIYLVNNTNNQTDHSNAALTWESLVKLPTLMLDRTYDQHWGRPANPDQLIYIANPELENDVMTLSEMMTVDKRGPQAAVNQAYAPLNGELCRIGRNPLITTIAQNLTEADGKVSTTAANNTRGQITCWNPNGTVWGTKREAMWEVEREASYDQWRFILSTRVAMALYSPTGALSGVEHVSGLFNIANN